MKNIIIILTFFTFGAALLVFTGYFEDTLGKQQNTSQDSIDASGSEDSITEEPEIIQEEDVVRTKIELIKKRLADKGIIVQGDSYYNSNQLPLALKKYLEFYKKNPKDPLIIEKIALTYFEMKRFGSSVNYLQKLDILPESQKEIFALSLIYSENITLPETQGKIISLLEKYNYTPEEIYYYTTSLGCISDFHNCKVSFLLYFGSGAQNQSGTGKTQTFPALLKISEAFKNYENFQLDDISLKNAFLIGAWYHNKLYPLSIQLGEKLLEEKPGYKPVLKIIAQSYYELGNYKKAQAFLSQYNTIDSNDAQVVYMMGVVYEKLKDYVVANIYLNKALDLGYKPSIAVRRQLIHNLYVLENASGMLQAFSDLVEQETSLEASDLGLAIYYHIIHEKRDQAKQWSKKGQTLFPNSGDFYAYEGWILREEGDIQGAFSVLQNALSIDPKNPFLLINIAYTAQAGGNIGLATVYFTKVTTESPASEWALQAEKELAMSKTSQK